jgi:ATPase subunit of ABC transporter with duplicated ATPase domains
MQYHLSAAGLHYLHADGSRLFGPLTFSFNMTRTGLIGPNGVGKSTLLEILAGRKNASSGSLDRTGRVAYLPQSDCLMARASVADALSFASEIHAHERIARGEGETVDFEMLENHWDLPERIDMVFNQLAISNLRLDQPARTLSGGELMRVRLAGLLLLDPDFLLLDEPTNHLDSRAREFVYQIIQTWKKGLVVVSHDRVLLRLVDEIAEMDRKGIKFYGGNFDFYKEQREIERASAEQTLASAELRLKRARAVAQRAAERQQKRASAGRKAGMKANLPAIAAGGLKRKAENTASRLQERHERKIDSAISEARAARERVTIDSRIIFDLKQPAVPAGKRMVEMTSVNYRYPGARRPVWDQPVDMLIVGAERVRLNGPNGSGKSTIVSLIRGKLQPASGTVKVGTQRTGLLDQRLEVLDDSLTVYENLKRVAMLRPEHELRILLGRFLFIKDDVFKKAGVLSGGERMRAGLACLLGADQAPEILLLDEPTNNLDLSSVEAISSAIKNYRGALIVISHDRSFLEDIGIERTIEIASRPSGLIEDRRLE